MKQALYNRYPIVNNRYRVIEWLGKGGMANVYLARDAVLDRNVALKVLSHRFADDEEFVERFRREARIAAALSHPNITSVYDLGKTEDGSYYIAMEYVPGDTLRELISQKSSLTPTKAVEITIQIAKALKIAHAYGTIHRDIKPQNVLLTAEQQVKVVDFGIAQAATLSAITKEGHVLGTEHYMSPEQAKGVPVGPQSDLYSLGVVMYEMLTGKLPYETYGPPLKSTNMDNHLGGSLLPPKKIDPLIPEKLSAIILRLLSEDPAHRYPDASTLIVDLEGVNRVSLASAMTRVISAAFPKEESIGNVATKAFNSAVQRVRTAYRSKVRKTRPYVPSASQLRHRGGRCKPVLKQHRKTYSRFGLPLLTLVLVLASVSIVGSSIKSQLMREVSRELEGGLGKIQYSLNSAMTQIERNLQTTLQTGVAQIEHKLSDNLKGIITPSSSPQQGTGIYSNSPNDAGGLSSQSLRNRPDKSSQRPLLAPQNNFAPQSPFRPYGNGLGGQFSPGTSNPSSYDLPATNSNGASHQGTYQPSR